MEPRPAPRDQVRAGRRPGRQLSVRSLGLLPTAVAVVVVLLSVPAFAAPGVVIAGTGNVDMGPDGVIGAGIQNEIRGCSAGQAFQGGPGSAQPATVASGVLQQYCIVGNDPVASGILAGGGNAGYRVPDGGNSITASTTEWMTNLPGMTPCPPFPPPAPPPPPPPAVPGPWSAQFTYLCNPYTSDAYAPHDSWIGAGVFNQIRGTNNSAILAGRGSSILHENIDIPWMPVCERNPAILGPDPGPPVGPPPPNCLQKAAVPPVVVPNSFGDISGMPWTFCGGGGGPCDEILPDPDCIDSPPRVDNLPLTQPAFLPDPGPKDAWGPERPANDYNYDVPGAGPEPNYQPDAPNHNKALPFLYRSGGPATCTGGLIHTLRLASDDLIGAGDDHLITDPNSGIWAGMHHYVNASESAVVAGMNNLIFFEYQDPSVAPIFTVHDSAIGAGQSNWLNRRDSFIGAGHDNYITVFYNSTILGGVQNALLKRNDPPCLIYTEVQYSFIGGGEGNGMNNECGLNIHHHGAIGGGLRNGAEDDAIVIGGTQNGAAGSFIGGGRSNGAGVLKPRALPFPPVVGAVGGGLENIGNGGAVFGGQTNTIISPTPVWDAAVAGGDSNTAGAFFAFVGGGFGGNKADFDASGVGGGNANQALAPHAFVAGGLSGWASGQDGSVLGGDSVRADKFAGAGGGYEVRAVGTGSGAIGGFQVETTGVPIAGPDAQYAFVGGGFENSARSVHSAIVGGGGAKTSNQAEYAYGSGPFNHQRGSAQSSEFVLRGQATNLAPFALGLDGGAPLVVPKETSWGFEGIVVARDAFGNSHGWTFQGSIKNHAGTTNVLGPPTVKTSSTDPAAAGWTLNVGADNASGSLRLQGAGASQVRYVAYIWVVQGEYA